VQLDRIELALRRRSPWEAIDLGLVMLRHWRGPVYRVWLAVVLPVAALILALLWAWPARGMLAVWWLKPVADCVLLKVFSEAIFGEAPAIRAVWRSLPALLRGGGLLSRLTWRRFTPYRSFELPALQLEGQRGKALRLRHRTLARKVGGYAFWLMFVCVHLVVIFEIGLVQLAGLLIPGEALDEFSLRHLFSGEAGLLEGHFFNLAWLAAESIVEPFYVAAGFSLYLNRRSELEGWDIEMVFRHMAEMHRGRARTTSPARRGAGLALIALLAGALLALPLSEASAREAPPPVGAAAGDASHIAREVLSDPVFGRELEEMRWQPRRRDMNERPADPPPWLRHFLALSNWLALGLRGVLYLGMALAGAALLIVLYRHSGRWAGAPPRPAARAPETLFGLDLRQTPPPADIPATAWAEAEAGSFAAALSLLYRGALVALIERPRVAFRDGDTENVCRQRAAGCVGEAALAYFSALLEAWKASAYAGSPPSLNAVRALCREWAEHFSGHGGAV
jgi:hypothetical protein